MFSYFIVKERSMEPSCREGDFVFVNKMSYLFFRPKVGQLVVLKDPTDPSRLILKRITDAKNPFFWVEGDNKGDSIDSRHFGWVPRSNIIGRVFKVSKSPLLKNECGDPHTFDKKWWGSYPQDRLAWSEYNRLILSLCRKGGENKLLCFRGQFRKPSSVSVKNCTGERSIHYKISK